MHEEKNVTVTFFKKKFYNDYYLKWAMVKKKNFLFILLPLSVDDYKNVLVNFTFKSSNTNFPIFMAFTR